ncbi:MAG: SDR family NAD(P)-dependent oxidoreductase, partial [Candidatus Heimdallarchaeaceae archaeon]
QIGHLKSAAGIASVIKVALALDKKILPPTINVQELNPAIDWSNSNLFVNLDPQPWEKIDNSIRRAGVSAFGFGGTNYHTILEEYIPEAQYIEKEKQPIVELKEQKEEVCFLYTGQGSQYLGMIKELYDNYPTVRKTIDEASVIAKESLNADLREIIFGSSQLSKGENEERLRQTEYTQPSLFVVEVALTRILKEKGIEPTRVAGHSLGEYTALVAAGVFSFEDGLKAVIERGKAMAKASKSMPGAMAAILTSQEKVKEIIEKVNEGYITVANYNSLNQTVISGEEKAVNKAIELFSARKIKAIKLNVSTAFHSIIVKDAEIEMERVLNSLTYNKPSIPVYSNVTGSLYPDEPSKIKELLINQLCNSVQWVKTIEEMYNNGGRIFVEVGPKKALYNFVKDILGEKEDIQTFLTLNPKVGELKSFNDTVSQLKMSKRREIETPVQAKEKIVYKESALDVLLKNKEINNLVSEPYFREYLKENSNLLSSIMKQGYEQFSKYRESLVIAEKAKYWDINFDLIGVTGVGIGLPGKNRAVFSDDNFDLILNGTNLIESVEDTIKQETLDKNIVRLVKSPDGNATFEAIDDISKVIQLAAQIGELNFKELGIEDKLAKALDSTFIMAIGAGLEALKDAGIPLVESKVVTSTGKTLKGSWTLPESLQHDTGIVFASAFPGYDNLVDEVTRHLVAKFENKTNKEIEEIFEQLINVVSNPEAKEEISNWFLEKQSLLEEKEEKYTFSREFLYKVLSMGHSQFAQFIKAKGPNTQVNAACASTTQAIGVAEDWIRTGRCKRVIVIAGDNAASKNLLPWIGGGFLAAGGVTTKADVKEAALPFGKERHGLIIGSASAGLVIESRESYEERGVKPIVDLVGTYMANSAYHGSRLDVKHISEELESFIEKVERRYNIDRKNIAKEGIFVSHETYTPARGGSAEAEIQSLLNVFKEDAYSMTIINTKGFTGHAMGAGIEEAVAIKAIEKGKIPPIANIEKLDPAFSKFKFSKGEKRRFSFALRLAAGFGSQLAFALFRLNTYDNRFSAQYNEWLKSLGGGKEELFVEGRVLKLKTDNKKKQADLVKKPAVQKTVEKKIKTVTKAPTDILQVVKDIISEKTGYETEVIEENMHLEEDLGIDSIKAAEIMNDISDKWSIPQEKLFEQFDIDTPGKIAKFISENTSAPEETSYSVETTVAKEEVKRAETSSVSTGDILVRIKEVIGKHTGYDIQDLDENYDLEEDLGIDTVKQAEIFGDLRDLFGLDLDETYALADYRTIADIAQAISTEKPVEKVEQVETEESGEIRTAQQPTIISEAKSSISGEEVTKEVLSIISEITGYDTEDIEIEMDLEEDLGVDSIKIAEILSSLGSKFDLEFDEMSDLSGIRTTEDIVEAVIKIKQSIEQTQTPTKTEEQLAVSQELKVEQEEEIVIRSVEPVLKPLEQSEVNKFNLEDKNLLLLDIHSKEAKYIYSLLEQKKAKVELVRINSEDSEKPNNNEYDLILILLPDDHNSANDTKYFEQLFLTLQQLDYNHNTKIVSYSVEDYLDSKKEIIPLSGGISAFVKTIGQEFELDIKHVYSTKPEELVTELENWDKNLEVIYSEGKRYIFSHMRKIPLEQLQKEKIELTEDDLILVTGGARGITYECIKELTKDAKPSIAIVGRTKLPEDVSELLFLTDKEIANKKEEIKEKLAQENEKVTPVMIEKAWKRFLNTVEIAKNILYLIENEVNANYYSADVSDEEQMKSVLSQIEEDFEKTITLIVHGAGIEESKAFKKKKLEMAKKIVQVKISGLYNILNNIDQSNLKKIICFSSIAGRFGNRGQVDYAFANGYLARTCWKFKQQGINALAIDWSAWADIGMATQGSILKVLKAAGITPIPLKEGTRIFSELTNYNVEQSELIVAGKLGLLLKEIEDKKTSGQHDTSMNTESYPMIDEIRKTDNGFIASKTLKYDYDLYMRDHQIQGLPIFPAVMGLEFFAEMFKLTTEKDVYAIAEVSFREAIKQFKNKNVELQCSFDTERGDMEIKTIFTDIKGVQKEKKHFFCKSVKDTTEKSYKKKKIEKRVIPLLSKEVIYQLFFHGPSFQVLENLNEIKGNIISTIVKIPNLPLFKYEELKTVLVPRAIEAALQTAGLYDMFINNVVSLPSKIKNLEVYKETEAVFAEAEFLKIEERHSFFNVKIYDAEGEVIMVLEQLGMIHTSMPINLDEKGKKLFQMIKGYHEIRTKVDDEKVAVLPIHKVVEEYRKNRQELENKLVAYEKTRFTKISNEKRKMEYLAGVILAKELFSKYENITDFRSIEIKKKSKGQPYFFNRQLKEETDWYVSISHSNDFAVVSIEKQPVGIDIEKVEERSKSFYGEVFSDYELSKIADDH